MRKPIYESSFQPFESRKGSDSVIKLEFHYDPDLIALLKRVLREYKDMAVDPSRHIFQPGGWVPREKCWYVERAIWPMVKYVLEDSGYDLLRKEEPYAGIEP